MATLALANSQREWQAIFAGGPYTMLKMLEYIMAEGGKTAAEFLEKPKTALVRVTPDIISGRAMDQMGVTWASRTGRCTSLAVKAVHNLGRPAYDWCIYDLEGHRVARCRRTGIVIDSSSTVEDGAFILPEGE
jgi:hypothetical protein